MIDSRAAKVLEEFNVLMSKEHLTAEEAKRLLKLKQVLGLHLKWPNHPIYETRYGS